MRLKVKHFKLKILKYYLDFQWFFLSKRMIFNLIVECILGIYEDLLKDGLSDEEIHNLIVHQCYQGNKHRVSYISLRVL